MLRESLNKQVREASVKGSEVLKKIEKAISRLDQFSRAMEPLQQFSSQFEETASTIDQKINQVKDLQQLSKEAQDLAYELQHPSDPRSHLKNVSQAQNLLAYYERKSSHPNSASLVAMLKKALGEAYEHSAKIMDEQTSKYTKVYGMGPIAEDQAQKDLVEVLQQLAEVCRNRAPQFIQGYISTRSEFLHKSVQVPDQKTTPYTPGSHKIIHMLSNFIKNLKHEKELEDHLFPALSVTENLNQVSDKAFQELRGFVQCFLEAPTKICESLDILSQFQQTLVQLERLLGKSAKYYNMSRLYTSVLQKCQQWYRDYATRIQELKIEVGEFVHELSFQLFEDLKSVQVFWGGLTICKLENISVQLVMTLIDTFKIKVRSLSTKNPSVSRVFLMNNISFWLKNLRELETEEKEQFKSRLEKDLQAEIDTYLKTTWTRVSQVLNETPVLEYKKNNTLTNSSRKALKNKFKAFNQAFSETFNYHKSFSFYSLELISYLRERNYSILVPGYSELLRKYYYLDFSKRKEQYFLFSAEKVESGVKNMYNHRTR